MRTILFFDLPSVTLENLKHYRKFIKVLKVNGFYRIQESVFVKMSIDQQAADSTINRISLSLPPNGNIITLTITEKQFSSMKILLGESKSDVLMTDEKTVIL